MSRVVAHASPPIAVTLCASLLLVACSGEGRDWRSAEAADTVEAYDRFIERHPESVRAEAARARLAQLTEEREWQRASTANTPESYRAFLAQHPNGKWAGEARIRLESLALGPPPEAPPLNEGFGIQLGAYSSEEVALQEWAKVQAGHPSELEGLKPQVVRAASTAGATVYRLQTNVGPEADARDICAALSQASQPCVVVLPPR
jgi:hypothetical protein